MRILRTVLVSAGFALAAQGCAWDLVVNLGDGGDGHGGGEGGGAGGGGGAVGGGGGGVGVGGAGGVGVGGGGGGAGVGGAGGKGGGGGGLVDAGFGGGGGVTCTGPAASCYTGKQGTDGVGVCRRGTQSCMVGAPCVGEVVPSVESCNGLDDDCNGQVDDALGYVTCGLGACKKVVSACTAGRPSACVPGTPLPEDCANSVDDDCDGVINNGCNCTYVAPTGSDLIGTGSAGAPFQSIGWAISRAGSAGLGKQVCVASSGPACSATNPSVAIYSESLVMSDGISVFGGYRNPADGGAWTRPPSQILLQPTGSLVRSGCATVINSLDPRGVYFGHQVSTKPTSLDGFWINAALALATTPDAGSPGTAAVTVEGSTGALINDNLIVGGGSTAFSPTAKTIGVAIDGTNNPATPILSNNAIVGGTGAVSIGVVSVNAAPQIQDSCTNFDAAGRCTDYGCDTGCTTNAMAASRFIRARPNVCPPVIPSNAAVSYGVLFAASPGASLSRSAVCTSPVPGEAVAVRIAGNSQGVTVRGNHLTAEGSAAGAVNAVGVWADACGGASPWIVDNAYIAGAARTPGSRGDGIRAVGDCPIRVDSNQIITGGLEASASDAYGVYCARSQATGVSSRCTVLNNLDIAGSGGGFPPVAAGVRCDDGACARIEGNGRISARSGQRCFGIILGETGATVARNTIEAGCALTLGVGVLSNNSFARIENNAIGGPRSVVSTGGVSCNATAPNVYGLLAVLVAGANELDVHSNDIFALGTGSGNCVGRALSFDVVAPCTSTPCLVTQPNLPAGPLGVIRNNILHAGSANTGGCVKSFAVEEVNAASDPRVFENNDLWYSGMATALYLDEGINSLATPAAVNAMTDITVSGVVSVNPLVTSTFNFPLTPLTNLGVVPPTDVHLMPGSPLVDAGTPVGAPPFDFYGTPRPQGAGWDIGAHEQ